MAVAGDASTPLAVRLYGIDAPEKDQPGGQEAREYLISIMPKKGSLEIIPQKKDRYGRQVALVTTRKRALNVEMIKGGHAWVEPKYCRAKFCKSWAQLQKEASEAGRWLWASPDPVPPWQWRKK